MLLLTILAMVLSFLSSGFPMRIALFLLVMLCACARNFPSDHIDPSGKLSRQDYLELRARDALLQPPIPALPILSDQNFEPPLPLAPPPSPLQTKRITLSVTEDVPLKDVFADIGRKGQMNLEIDPRVSGGVIFSAHDQPLQTVLERLCDLAGLRFSIQDGFLRIEPDDPYQKSYALSYPSLARKTTSEVSRQAWKS